MKKKTKSVRVFFNIAMGITLIFLLLSVNGCTRPVAGHRGMAESGPIYVGAAWPFSTKNQLFKQGVDLAVSQVNDAGGVLGRKIVIIAEDDGDSVTRGLQVAQSFANNPRVVAVIGHRASFVSLPAAAVYQRAGILMMNPASTAVSITNMGYSLVFRCIPSDKVLGGQMAAFAARKDYKSIAIFYDDNDYGRDLANSFEDEAAKLGINIADRITYFGDSAQMNRLKDKWDLLGVDAVFVAAAMPEAGQFIRAARAAGISQPMLGGDALDTQQLMTIAGAAAQGTVVGSVFNPKKPQAQWFVQCFRQKYGEDPTVWAAQGYDAVRLLAYAIKKAESTQPVKMAAVLRKTKNWDGVIGTFSFEPNGDIEGDVIVKKVVTNGHFVYLTGE